MRKQIAYRRQTGFEQDKLQKVLGSLVDSKLYLDGWVEVRDQSRADSRSDYEANKADLEKAYGIRSLREYRRFVRKECRFAWKVFQMARDRLFMYGAFAKYTKFRNDGILA